MKPRPRLQDMPVLIKRQIAGHLDFYTDKMSLRFACPNFRPIIGDPEIECERLGLSFRGLGKTVLDFRKSPESHFRHYIQHENGCEVKIDVIYNGKGKAMQNREWFVEGGNFIDLATRDFGMLTDNPNFVARNFTMTLYQRCREYSVNETNSLLTKAQSTFKESKLKVKELKFMYKEDQGDVLKILPHLDSEVLESLELNNSDRNQTHKMDEIVKLEQFKKLQKLKLFGSPKLPIESWWDIPETRMTLRYVELMDLKRILEHFREAPNFRESVLWTDFRADELSRVLRGPDAVYRENSYGFNDRFSFLQTETSNDLNVSIINGYVHIKRTL